jgi:hypothetical protein
MPVRSEMKKAERFCGIAMSRDGITGKIASFGASHNEQVVDEY